MVFDIKPGQFYTPGESDANINLKVSKTQLFWKFYFFDRDWCLNILLTTCLNLIFKYSQFAQSLLIFVIAFGIPGFNKNNRILHAN
jgi:hypothetical protein